MMPRNSVSSDHWKRQTQPNARQENSDREPNSMNKKKVITWEDADMNLCIIAASILDSAMMVLRATNEPPYRSAYYRTDDGTVVPDDYASDEDRTVYSWPTLSPICWWSFQNLVRIRLREARKEIKNNLYGRGNRPKESGQSSRNPNGRSGSKFGRQPSRE